MALNGNSFGFDFNPVVDRLRIVSDNDQNLRVNVDTGAALVDGDLSYPAGGRNARRNPSVVGVAYSNPDNDPNTGTVLYDVDAGLDILARQDPPNNGTLNTIGGLGVDTGALVGFDIGRRYGGLAALQPGGGASRLHSVDLDSGRARDRGRIGGGESVKGLAIPIDGDRYDGGGDG